MSATIDRGGPLRHNYRPVLVGSVCIRGMHVADEPVCVAYSEYARAVVLLAGELRAQPSPPRALYDPTLHKRMSGCF